MIQPIRPQDASGIYQRQIAQADDARDAAGGRAAEAGTRSGRRIDRVLLSPQAQQLLTAQRAVARAGEIREARVEALRARVENGSYRVDARGVAEQIIDSLIGDEEPA